MSITLEKATFIHVMMLSWQHCQLVQSFFALEHKLFFLTTLKNK